MPASPSRLALLGGKPLGGIAQPPHPRFSKRAIARVTRLLETGRTVGLNKLCPEIREAEDAVSRYHGGLHCLGTSSGHSALQMALAGLEVGPGDEVITTPYTWGASISCILHQGAVPVFADVDPETGLLDPDAVEAAVTRRTRAVLVVHIFGQPADMTRFGRIARKHKIALVEDGSQSHGAKWKGKKVGNFGDASGFSCMGGKLLATIEAGYMVAKKKDVYWRASLLSQHMGRREEPDFPAALRPYADSLVYTYRMNPVTAVLLVEQLKKLDREVEGRRKNVARLRGYLADARFVRFPDCGKHAEPSYHYLTLNFDARAAGVSRAAFLKALWAEGLEIGPYIPAPIPHWPRMQWKGYKGPRAPWMEQLRRAGIDYGKQRFPNCVRKIESSMEIIFNFCSPAKDAMRRIADVFHKVEAGIDPLREYERKG